MLTIPLFVLGLFIGSFLNVLIYRLPRNESIAFPPSHCPHCRRKISPYDLIPVLSYLLLQGKCRHCKERISLQYPIVELVTALLFGMIGIFFPYPSFTLLQTTLLFYIISSLVALFVIDIKNGILPFVIVFPLILVSILYTLLYSQDPLAHFLSGMCAFLFFLMIFFLTKGRGMGFGDAVYALFMGLFLGFPGVVYGLYIAFLTGTAVSLILIVAKRKTLKGSTIAFGPFLVFGTITLLFWEQHISKLVLRIFGF